MPWRTGEITVALGARFQPVRRMNIALAYAWKPQADVTASENPAGSCC